VKAADLPICPKCGWHDGFAHASECDPHRGHTADALIAAVKAELPALRTSKLGHGFGYVTIKVSEACSLTLLVERQVERHATYRIEGIYGLFWLRSLDVESVVRLACVLVLLDDKLQKKALRS
jgi:hypothetical protein